MSEQKTPEVPGVDYRVDDGLAWVILNRPHRGNAFTAEMQIGLKDIWIDVRDNPAIRAAIIMGTGDRFFCTGVDVKEVAERGRVGAGRGSVFEEVVLSPRQNGVWKPVIAAINGLCIGGGLHFAVESDVIVAAEHAEFADAHVDVGMVGAVENIGLAKRLPLGTALRMTLMGRHFRLSAQRAWQLGLVDEIVPADQLAATVETMARTMMKNSPAAMALSQQAVWGSLDRGYSDAIEYGWALLRMHWGHPDFVEGPRAFAEKREPEWTVDRDATRWQS